MSKHSRLLKIALGRRCAEGESSRTLAQEQEIDARQIRYWASVFRLHGAKSFDPRYRPSTASEKLQAIKSMQSNKWSISYTAAAYNLSSSGILIVWLRNYEARGVDGLQPKRQRAQQMNNNSTPSSKPVADMTAEEMREELEYLRAENAVQKKLLELGKPTRPLKKTKRGLSQL